MLRCRFYGCALGYKHVLNCNIWEKKMFESLKLLRICNTGFRQRSCKYIFLLCFIGLQCNLVLDMMSIWRTARAKYEAEKQGHN